MIDEVKVPEVAEVSQGLISEILTSAAFIEDVKQVDIASNVDQFMDDPDRVLVTLAEGGDITADEADRSVSPLLSSERERETQILDEPVDDQA